jgi:hypothetical protein
VKAVVDARFAIGDALARAQLDVEHKEGVHVMTTNPSPPGGIDPRWTGD